MELKELEEFLKDENDNKEFSDYVKGIGFETPDDIQGLKNKNSDLISTQKKLKEQIGDLQKRLDEIDIDEYNELKNKSGNNDEVSKLTREFKRLQEKFDESEKSRSGLETELNKTLKINALNSAFDEFKIDPLHRDTLREAFANKTKIEIDGDARRVLVDDGDGLGVETAEYFKKWIETDKGKLYLTKPENKGAGSNQLGGSGSKKQMKRDEFSSLPVADQMKLSKEGIELTN